MEFPKTKNQIANELGISLRTLQRWIKKSGLKVPRGLISPEKQIEIKQRFGYPTYDHQNKKKLTKEG